MSQPATAAKLTSRDLINVGVFTAIYFAIQFLLGMLGIIGPVFMFVGFVIIILANGIVVALYLARVPKLGVMTIMGFIIGLLMVLTGHPWQVLLVATGFGLIADLIAKSGQFRSPIRNIVSYAVFTTWMISPLLPMLWNQDAYSSYITKSMGAEYAKSFFELFNANTMGYIAIFFFVMGLVGGALGQRVLRRQFRRAGVA